jgi:hypothetical protein
MAPGVWDGFVGAGLVVVTILSTVTGRGGGLSVAQPGDRSWLFCELLFESSKQRAAGYMITQNFVIKQRTYLWAALWRWVFELHEHSAVGSEHMG